MSLGKIILGTQAEVTRNDVTDLLPLAWQKALGEEKVFVQDMNAGERAQYLKARSADDSDVDDLTLLMICLVDKEGKRIFEAKQRGLLEKNLPGSNMLKLVHAAMEICGFFWDPAKVSKSEPETEPSSPSASV